MSFNELDLSAGFIDPPKPRRGGISRDRILQIARSDNIPDNIADDFSRVMNFESGGSHYNRRGKVKLSPPDPKTGERAVGAAQIKPSTAREVGVDDPFDEDKNLLAGLRYFRKGGDDPAGRRIHYFGGPRPLQRYQRTGRIPKGKDVLGTTFQQYVQQTGGQQKSPKIDLSAGLDEAPPKMYETTLSADEEGQFQQWKKRYAPNDSGADYDLRGAYKAGLVPDVKTGHWPDTFKKPNHPTFSIESKYAVGPDRERAGHWQGDKFIPPIDLSAGLEDSGQNQPPALKSGKPQTSASPNKSKAPSVPKPRLPRQLSYGEMRRTMEYGPPLSWADLKQADDRALSPPLPNRGLIPAGVDPRVLKGEQPADRLAHMRQSDLVTRQEPRPTEIIRDPTPSISGRPVSRLERAAEAIAPYVPGLSTLDTPAGPKTDVLRGAVTGATLGAVDLRRPVTLEERLLNPQAETEKAVAELIGSTAGNLVPFMGTAKLVNRIASLQVPTRAAAAARVGLTFGTVETARQAIQAGKTGEFHPDEILVSTAIGAAMGAIPAAQNPTVKSRIVAAILPQALADYQRGVPLEQAVLDAGLNLGFEGMGVARDIEGRQRGQAEAKPDVTGVGAGPGRMLARHAPIVSDTQLSKAEVEGGLRERQSETQMDVPAQSEGITKTITNLEAGLVESQGHPAERSLVDEVASLVDERGGLTRGGDYSPSRARWARVNDLMKGRSNAEVQELLYWTQKHPSRYVQRFVGGRVDAELRSRAQSQGQPAETPPLPPTSPEAEGARLPATPSTPELSKSANKISAETPTVPERPETIALQMEALQQGRREAVLIPRGTWRPDLPKGMSVTRTPEGLMYFDPRKVSLKTIRAKLADGTSHELLGHVEPKPPIGAPTAVVTAREKGTEVQSSVVSPERASEQAAETQARHPEAQVEVGGPELANQVIAERTAALSDRTRDRKANDVEQSEFRPPKTTDQRERLIREEQDRQAELNPERAAALATEGAMLSQRFYHKDWGEVEVLEDQSGARPGRVKVAEVADPTKQHYPKKSDLRGRGNERMAPVRPIEKPESETFLRDESGQPLTVYHQTTKEAEHAIRASGFDLSKARARRSDEGVPDGVFFKPDKGSIFTDLSDSDSAELAANLRIKSPLEVGTREELVEWARSSDPEYAKLADKVQSYDRRQAYENREKTDEYNNLIKDATGARARLTEALRREGYDGVIIERDVGGPQVTKTYIALDPNQVRLLEPEATQPPRPPSGWGSGGGTTDALEEMARTYRAKPEGEKGPPQPLPPLKNGVTPEQVQEAWNAVSARYPRIARLVKGIAQVEDLPSKAEALGGKRAMAAVDRDGILWINAGENLTRENAYHEITHLAQRARKRDWKSVGSEEAAKNRGLLAGRSSMPLVRADAMRSSVNPERTAALAKLEEIKRRGMTVDDYARQPDLSGKVPSAEEVALLRELASAPGAVAPGGEPTLFGPGTMRAGEPLPELEGNYRKPLKAYSDTLYREVGANGALDMLPTSRRMTDVGDVYLTNTPDLALGQGSNRGILLEFESGDLEGQVNRSKPGWEPLYKQGQAEFIARLNKQGQYQKALKSVTVKPDAKMSRVERMQIDRALSEMEEAGWTKTGNADGSVTYQKPAPAKKFGPGTMRAGEPLPEVKERKFGKRFVEDERIAEEIRETIGTAKYYEPIPEKVTAANARELIDKRGVAESMQIIRDEKNDIPFHVRVVMSEIVQLRLNRAFNNLKDSNPKDAELILNQGNEMAEHLMDFGTRLGQGVQAFAQWARQGPEGILLTYKKATRAARERRQKLYAADVKEVVETLNKPGMSDAERVQALKDLFGTNKTARKVKSELDKILAAAKSGKLTDTLFYEIVGDKLGLPGYNKGTAAKITDLALQIEAAPEGLPKDTLLKELANVIATEKGFDPSDLPIGIYYTHILSGYNTHAVNIEDTAVNVLSEINGVALAEPRAAAWLYSGLLRGLNEGKFDALLALTKGRMLHDSKWLDAGGLMEVAKFGKKGGVPIKTETRSGRFAKRVAESKIAIPLNAYKYVSRAMAAADAVNARGAQEARASLLAYRMAKAEGLKGAEFENRVREILALDRMSDFEAQAKREGFTGTEAKYRAQELRDMMRDKDLMGDAREFAGEATYNHKPHGTLGLFAGGLRHYSNRFKPLKLFVPFTQIVANVTNRGLNWTPYGYKRALTGWGFGDFREPITGEARRAMLVRATVGTAGMAMLGALQGAGVLQIHGNGPGDREKRRQLQNAGWRPYSIQIGNSYIPYQYSPVGLGLSILGNMSDSQRYHELEQKDAATRGAYAVARLGSTVFSQSFLSGLSRLFGALSDEPSQSVTSVKQVLSGTTGAFLVPNITRDMYRLFDNKAYQSNTLMEDLIRNTPFAALALRPTLNAFGEPVKLQRQRFFGKLTSDPAWNFVIKKGLRVPVPGRTSEIEKDVRISPEQYYTLLQKSGPQIKEWIIENRADLEEMTEQDAQEALSNAAAKIRKFELDQIRMEQP